MQAIAKVQQRESPLMKYFRKFEPLAERYARQIFDEHKIGFEFEDLVQEFRIKIYTSIIGYAKYAEARRQTRYEPWPITVYVQRALVNKKKDFIKQISESPTKALSVEQHDFDYGIFQTMESHIVMNKDQLQCEINGVDLLQGLTEAEARCFMLFLRGYTVGKLARLFKPVVPNTALMIQKQCALLQNYKKELLQNTTTQFLHFSLENDN
jgi:hypothetical protein